MNHRHSYGGNSRLVETLRPTHLIENNKVVVLVKEVIPETGVHELLLVEKTFQKAVLKTYFSTESEGYS